MRQLQNKFLTARVGLIPQGSSSLVEMRSKKLKARISQEQHGLTDILVNANG